GDDLLARERAAAALDHVQVLGHLVGAVDVDRQLIDAIQVEDADAVLSQAFGARLRRGHRAFDAALDRSERVDEEVDGRARAHADHSVFHHVLQRLLSDRLLELVLGQAVPELRGGPTRLAGLRRFMTQAQLPLPDTSQETEIGANRAAVQSAPARRGHLRQRARWQAGAIATSEPHAHRDPSFAGTPRACAFVGAGGELQRTLHDIARARAFE